LKFLGFRLQLDGRRLLSKNITRFTRRLRQLHWLNKHDWISQADVARSVQAWLAHVGEANSAGIRQAIRRRLRCQVT
jgi:hypothetical protein